MTISDNLLDNVKKGEGLRLTAYKDSLGFWTVGYGHKLATGKDWTDHTISLDEAGSLLAADLSQAATQASVLPEWGALDAPARQDALIEIVYNMGMGWKKFVNTRAAISDQNWQGVHDGLLASLWAAQVHGRAIRIALQMLKGTYV